MIINVGKPTKLVVVPRLAQMPQVLRLCRRPWGWWVVHYCYSTILFTKQLLRYDSYICIQLVRLVLNKFFHIIIMDITNKNSENDEIKKENEVLFGDTSNRDILLP